MSNITIKTPKALFNGKVVVKVIRGYKVEGDQKLYKTLSAATDSYN